MHCADLPCCSSHCSRLFPLPVWFRRRLNNLLCFWAELKKKTKRLILVAVPLRLLYKRFSLILMFLWSFLVTWFQGNIDKQVNFRSFWMPLNQDWVQIQVHVLSKRQNWRRSFPWLFPKLHYTEVLATWKGRKACVCAFFSVHGFVWVGC